MRVIALTPHPDLPEAHLLAGMAARGVVIRAGIAPSSRHRELLVRSGIECIPLEFRNRFDLGAVLTLRRWIGSFEPDLIHAFTARSISCAVLATVGMDMPIVAYRGTMGNVGRMDPTSWFTYLSPKVRRVVCVSRAVQEDLLAHRPDREVVVQVYKGHDCAWYENIRPASRQEWGIGPEECVICCTANMRPLKGVDVLVRAFARLVQTHPAKLLLVGEVRDPTITSLVKEEGIASRTIFTGFQPEATSFTAISDIFVMPSLRREGFPKAVIEAMALSRAIIVSRVGGMPEMIEDGVSGYVVAPGDVEGLAARLAALVTDRDLARRFGEEARRVLVSKFHVSSTIAEMLAVYRECVPEGGVGCGVGRC